MLPSKVLTFKTMNFVSFIDLLQSPDGLTVVSAEADETLRFWEVFGPPAAENSKHSNLDSFLSFKNSPIR